MMTEPDMPAVDPADPAAPVPPTAKQTFHAKLTRAYDDYRADPAPAKLNSVIEHLKPTIHYALSSIGSSDDPYLKNQARLLAARAVKKYDASAGTGLPTWVSGQLMQLRRVKRLTSMPVKIPERTQLGAYQIMRAEMEFMDREGREPDAGELADESKMSVRQIAKIKKSFRKMPSQTEVGDALGGETTDYTNEALDYLYNDLDHVDRQILEHRTGYGGADVMRGPALMRRLRITPTQLSRRSARIAMRLQAIERNLNTVNNPDV
jgi:hypothetical protein